MDEGSLYSKISSIRLAVSARFTRKSNRIEMFRCSVTFEGHFKVFKVFIFLHNLTLLSAKRVNNWDLGLSSSFGSAYVNKNENPA